jgi:hypothetical protein
VVVLQIVRKARSSRSRPRGRRSASLADSSGGRVDGTEELSASNGHLAINGEESWSSVTFSDLVSRWQEELKAAAENAALSGETLLLESEFDQDDQRKRVTDPQGRLARLVGTVYHWCATAISNTATHLFWERGAEIVDPGLTGLNNLGNTCTFSLSLSLSPLFPLLSCSSTSVALTLHSFPHRLLYPIHFFVCCFLCGYQVS